MIYRDLDETYIEKLAELYVDTYNAPPWNDKWTILLAAKRLDEMINCRDSYGLVCFDDESNMLGMIVGSRETYYDHSQFYIKDYFVIPSCHGRGIGSALLNEFESRLKVKGITKTYLFTSRTEQTEGFYQKRGYQSWNGMVMMGKVLA